MGYGYEKGIHLNLVTNIKNQYGTYGSVITTYDPTTMLIDLTGFYDYFKTTDCYNYIKECSINKRMLYNFHIADIDVNINNIFTIAEILDAVPYFKRNFFKIYKDIYLKDSDGCYIVSNNLPKNINKIKIRITNNKYKNITYKHVTRITEYQKLLGLKSGIVYKFGNIDLLFKDKDQVSNFYKSISDLIPILYTTYQEVDTGSDLYKELLNKIDWDNHVYNYYETHNVEELNINKNKLNQLLRSFINGFIEFKKKEYLDSFVENYYILKSKLLRWKDIILLKNVEKEEIAKYDNKDLNELYKYVNNNDNYCIIDTRYSNIDLNLSIPSGIKTYMFDVNKLSSNERDNFDYNLLAYNVILKHYNNSLEISEVFDQINDPNEFDVSMAMQTHDCIQNVVIKTNLIPEDLEYHWMYDEIYWRLSIPKKFLDSKLCSSYKSIKDVLEVLKERLGKSTLFVIREDLVNDPDAFQRYKKYVKCLVDTYKTSQEIGLYDIPSIIYYKDNKAREISIDNLLSTIDKMKEGFKFKIGSIKLTDKFISILKEKYLKDCVYKDFKDIIDTICREKEK